MDLNAFIARAQKSTFHLWVLNVGLNYMVPFNKPHGFQVIAIDRVRVKTKIPYKKRNFNHIRGLHACALATISEFTTGLLLLSRLGSEKYRLIMQRLEMDYHYQGKMDAFAEFVITEAWLNDQIFNPLTTQDAVVIPCEIKIVDAAGNHLTTGKVFWQIKNWSKVKTKVAS
jgi:acyl-coenzyme A thioesterase PaaI-like protein